MTYLLTYLLTDILKARDASASKNILRVAQLPVKVKPIFANKRTQDAPIFGSTPESWAMKRAATAFTKR